VTAQQLVQCARCQHSLPIEQAEEVGEEQATTANLVWVHRSPCPTGPAGRGPRVVQRLL
jgi:hypothetical protein